ncbi:MAG: S41 family peptidase [Parvularculaceae bacterium]|jgi:carboxyl-terminal processing protease|nr:S41 family peptidase [Parvularculaceae bacterium]
MKKPKSTRRQLTLAVSGGAVAAAFVCGALVSGAVLSAGFARSVISADTFRQLDLFGEVFEQVHENYVTEPDDKELIHGAIDGMLLNLDPHSNYMTAEEFTRMQEQTRGTFAGLGIQVTMDTEGPDKGFVKVISPIDDTPAQRAGIQTNDLIVEINGEAVQGLTIDDAISKLKGPKGTSVEIKVVRKRDQPPFDLKLVRDIVNVPSVTAKRQGDFGYIRISNFSEQTEEGLTKAFRTLEKEIPGGPKGFVLDLRSNPGGLLEQAVAVSDAFLEGGEIVSTRGRRVKDTLREMGTPGDRTKGKPIVVLIDGGSASAAEIVAGALQDRNRALLLGTKSFGKGSVQTVIPLQNGLQGALRLTTARYYTPSGRSIQAEGIDPDIEMPILLKDQEEVLTRPGEKDLPRALDVKKDPVKKEAPGSKIDEKAAQPAKPEASAPAAPGASAGKPADAKTADAATKEGKPKVEPVRCDFERFGDDNDCQMKRALEILADQTSYRRALAEAGAVRRQ